MKEKPGYLFIDHRFSPGLGGDLAGGTLFETDTLTCNHCKIVSIKNKDRTRERGECFKCNQYLCDNCAIAFKITNICRPFSQVVDDLLDGKTNTPILARHLNG